MIREIEITNFKKFRALRCKLPNRAVIAGPNGVGKTTLLQAISTWFQVAGKWRAAKLGLDRDRRGEFPEVHIDLRDFGSVPLAGYGELWTDQAVTDPVSIRLATDRWNIEIEILHDTQDRVLARPACSVSENDIECYLDDPSESLYISPLSGIESRESKYDPDTISTRLVKGLANTVIRNMIQEIHNKRGQWNDFQKEIQAFFPDHELSIPSGTDPIRANYRRSSAERWYDLVNGGSGFLQILLINAALLYKESPILLIDELDVHLYALLKEKMYNRLRSYSIRHKCQMLIATHSSQIINSTDKHEDDELYLATARGLRKINRKQKCSLEQLMHLEPIEILHAETTGAVLYLEGISDLEILRSWAKILEHRALSHLDSPFCVYTAEKKGKNFSREHFRSLQLYKEDIRGVEIRDRNSSSEHRMKDTKCKMPQGIELLYWSRYEIENYLVHPSAIRRLFEEEYGKDNAENAETYMRNRLPPVRFSDPFVEIDTDKVKGKEVIEKIVAAAAVDLKKSEYYKIAKHMKKDEIHTDVRTILDAIAKHLPERQ